MKERVSIYTAEEIEKRRKHFEQLADILDRSIKIPGTSIELGVDSILGFIPGVGDFAGAGISSYLLYQAYILGVSKVRIASMVSNSVIDAISGVVPVFGDFFDIYFKSNSRNADILAEAIENETLEPRSGKLLIFLILITLFLLLSASVFFVSMFLYKIANNLL